MASVILLIIIFSAIYRKTKPYEDQPITEQIQNTRAAFFNN